MTSTAAAAEPVAAQGVDEPLCSLRRLQQLLVGHPDSLRILLAGTNDPFPQQFRMFLLNSNIVVEPTADLICRVQMCWLQERYLPAIGLRGERPRLSAPDVPGWEYHNDRARLIEDEADLRAVVEELTSGEYRRWSQLRVHDFVTQCHPCQASVELSGDTLRISVPVAVEQSWMQHRARIIADLLGTAEPRRG